ncbi:MAG: nucleotidyl transferase AbiEii/AbiGii toxin family protein [Candidatus Absconditabacterales bacterium]|nr:nucleotidyl transferase AbiEii/AbiGii toxin family protein [Candidatus Absconditabacterales bacterium]
MLKLKILEERTKILFDKIAKEGYEFPLVGGTGLSLRMGHRKSIDLDFAVARFISNKDIEVFKKVSKRFEIVYQSKEQINMFVDYVKVTVFSYFYKNHFPSQKYKKLKIWDLKDIAVSKAFTIGRREELKDYVDLYFILKEKVLSLDEIIKLAKEKYQGEFSEKLFLKQLLLINEVGECEIKYLRDPATISEIDDFFRKLVKEKMEADKSKSISG